MYITSCPLRISLFGGSTDNPAFIKKYSMGAVISFSSNLRTYITTHQDKLGYNLQAGKYIINYSKREEVNSIGLIQNEPVKVVLKYFNCDPMTVSLTSDAYSQGSGLASSSSYIISLIKNICLLKNLEMLDIDICALALSLEQKFNPHCGHQDPYGCCIGGFKKIEFNRGGEIKYNFLSTKIFDYFDMHLVFTNVMRNSTSVLKEVTKNIDRSYPLIELLNKAYEELIRENYDNFISYINQSWEIKKNTTSKIIENTKIKDIDSYLTENKSVIAHKLCGAGNGGFFLTFSKKNKLDINLPFVKVNVDSRGVLGEIL